MVNPKPNDTRFEKPRILIFSYRNIFGKALFRCPHFEFEDVICEIDSAELLAPEFDADSAWSRFAMRLAYHAPITLNPGLKTNSKEATYDVFFAICGGLARPHDLLILNAASNWRERCRTSVCLLDEVWIKQLYDHRYFLRVLSKFDVVILYYSQTVKPLSEQIGHECVFLPPGIDAERFCPSPKRQRVIDVYSIGRRAEITHRTLLNMARDTGLFYIYDSMSGNQSINAREHRSLFANIAKRSRYFIVNPGLIDQPEKRGNQFEIGNRYFEGAASGAIMIGQRPDNEEFERLFDWPEAVTELPYNSAGIDRVIKDVDLDPERQDRIRRAGITQALMRHDWVYRWEAVLKTVGLEPIQRASERKERLRKLAEVVSLEGGVVRV
jgi:hypothetical protein